MNDDPQFGQFAKEISMFYENDDLAPGIHVSYINTTPYGDQRWYVAIHRYPYTGERRMERVVVCSQIRISFGVALIQLYREWKKIRNLSYEEEQHNRVMLGNEVNPRNNRGRRRSRR